MVRARMIELSHPVGIAPPGPDWPGPPPRKGSPIVLMPSSSQAVSKKSDLTTRP